MARTRVAVSLLFGFAMILACSSRGSSDCPGAGGDEVRDAGGDRACRDGAGGDGADGGAGDGAGSELASGDGEIGASTDTAAPSEGSPQQGGQSAPFLGTWTLIGTEQYVCAAETSEFLPESMTMTIRLGPGPTDAGEVDLLFDGGLGCSLQMAVAGGVARLLSAPQTCGEEGKPIDRVFTSIELAAAAQFPGWLRLEETFTDQSGCAFLVQGYLLP
jgi:hypothetical protein